MCEKKNTSYEIRTMCLAVCKFFSHGHQIKTEDKNNALMANESLVLYYSSIDF